MIAGYLLVRGARVQVEALVDVASTEERWLFGRARRCGVQPRSLGWNPMGMIRGEVAVDIELTLAPGPRRTGRY